MNKKFDQALYDENDRIAKAAVANYLTRTKRVRIEEGTQYGVDLHMYQDDKLVGVIEVERRHNWVDTFPFRTVHVPLRKRKLLEGTPASSFLFSVRSDCAMALWCPGETILASPVVSMSNKYMDNEQFFDVPSLHWRLVDLNSGKSDYMCDND